MIFSFKVSLHIFGRFCVYLFIIVYNMMIWILFIIASEATHQAQMICWPYLHLHVCPVAIRCQAINRSSHAHTCMPIWYASIWHISLWPATGTPDQCMRLVGYNIPPFQVPSIYIPYKDDVRVGIRPELGRCRYTDRSGPVLTRFRHVAASLYRLQKMQGQEISDLMVVYSRFVFIYWW